MSIVFFLSAARTQLPKKNSRTHFFSTYLHLHMRARMAIFIPCVLKKMEEGKLNKLFPFGESDVGDKKGNIRQEAMVVNNKKKLLKKNLGRGYRFTSACHDRRRYAQSDKLVTNTHFHLFSKKKMQRRRRLSRCRRYFNADVFLNSLQLVVVRQFDVGKASADRVGYRLQSRLHQSDPDLRVTGNGLDSGRITRSLLNQNFTLRM